MRAELLRDSGDPPALPDGSFRVEARRCGATIVLECQGELDLAGVDAAQMAVAHAELSEAELIVLDMRRLEFLDCTGLGIILAARRRLHAGARAVEIVVPPDGPVRRLFTLVGLEALLRPGMP